MKGQCTGWWQLEMKVTPTWESKERGCGDVAN